MPERDLTPFFHPAAIAVIGASADSSHIRGRILTQLGKSQYPGRIIPVHPRGGEMLGLPVSTSIAAVGAPVDLALIAIPADAVAGVLEECAAAGVRAAYIFSSGFAEEGGDRRVLQERIHEIAGRTGMIIAGPNAVGFMNVNLPLVASFSPAVDFAALPGVRAAPAPRRIAVVSQSGGLAFAFFNRGIKRHLPFSYVVNTGNEAALDLVEIGEFLLSDPGTGVLLFFIEQVRRGPAFVALAERALRLGKPIIVAKIGRSAAARRAAVSHTASMTGADDAYEAVFHRYGVIRGEDQDDMLDIAAAAVLTPEPQGRRVGVITISGGVGGWLADTLETHGLSVPEFSAELQGRIRTFLPSFGAAGNPIDITGQAIGRDYRLRSIETLEGSGEVDAIVVGNSLAADSRLAVEKPALGEIAARRRKPILFYSYPLPSDQAQRDLEEVGIPLYTGIRGVARALSLLADRSEARAALLRSAPIAPFVASPARVVAAGLLDQAGATLTEAEALAVLRTYGVSVPRHRLVNSAADAIEAALDIGFPVALKVQSPEIPHKSDAGALALGLHCETEVADAYSTVLANARRTIPAARVTGVLVEAMVEPGLELILGVSEDETFGPLLLLGRGGVEVEALADRVMTPLPIDEAAAERMIRQFDRARLLDADRGRPARDRRALVELMLTLGSLAQDFTGRLREIDLNPVILGADGKGLKVVDALMVQGTSTKGGTE
jgi:acetate---CoA ligase (ADP-forming)